MFDARCVAQSAAPVPNSQCVYADMQYGVMTDSKGEMKPTFPDITKVDEKG